MSFLPMPESAAWLRKKKRTTLLGSLGSRSRLLLVEGKTERPNETQGARGGGERQREGEDEPRDPPDAERGASQHGVTRKRVTQRCSPMDFLVLVVVVMAERFRICIFKRSGVSICSMHMFSVFNDQIKRDILGYLSATQQ